MARVYCMFIIFLFSFPVGLSAAPLSNRLQAMMAKAVDPVPIIVRMMGVNVQAHVQGLSRRAARRELIGSLRVQAHQSQAALRDFLRSQGVADPTTLWLINGLAFSASPQLISRLQRWPGIELISVNQTIPRPVVMPAVASGNEWNVDMVGAPLVWAQGFDGSGVVIANLDTGVDVNHPDLTANWRGGTNSWFDPYTASTLPYDPVNPGSLSEGHGTAVMGLMVGGNNGGTSIGVAPGAQWIAAKIFPDTGPASNARIIQALGWVIDPDSDPDTDDGADVINNSWGFDSLLNQCLSGGLLSDFQTALSNLQAADVAVVFSAGNTGPLSGSSIPPGNMSGALSVGAVDANRTVATFSARGPSPCDVPGEIFPSLTAPGVAVRSADLTLDAENPDPYSVISGTSFAAAQVAGALALLRQAFPAPGNSMASLETSLQQMTVDLGAQGDDDDYGQGLLDVFAAFNLLQDINPVLTISDPTFPTDDLNVDFSSVAPLDSSTLTLVLKNGGGGSLTINSVDDSGLDPVFSMTSDLCSGLTLSGGVSCTVELTFSPAVLGSYTSPLTLNSTDPSGPHLVTLAGLGNSAPPAASLLLPDDGAVGIARPVDFSWQRGDDPDGDAVVDSLLISALGDFSDSTPITTALPQGLVLLAGGCLFWGLYRSPNVRQRVLLGFLLALMLLQVSCGGGGGSAAPAATPVASGGYQSSSLLPNTTYSWKIRSVDSNGGVAESAVRSFTTGS